MSNDNGNNIGGLTQTPRARRFRRLARAMALFLFAAAAVRLATGALPLIDPRLSTAQVTCDPCVLSTDGVRLLEPESVRERVRGVPSEVERLNRHLSQPKVKLLLFLAEMIRALPFFVMFLGMAMALRALAARGFNRDAVRWLRRAALAAIVWTIGQSAAASVRWTALSEITHGQATRHILLDPNSLIMGVMISGAAWVVLWALEEAQAMQEDLEEYI